MQSVHEGEGKLAVLSRLSLRGQRVPRLVRLMILFFFFFVLPVYKRTIFLPIGPWWYPTSTGYLRFPRVYLHITPSQTGTHVHAPANAPGFSHWTSIRSLSSKPSPPPPFCLRFLVSLFLSFLLFFFFCICTNRSKEFDLGEVVKLATFDVIYFFFLYSFSLFVKFTSRSFVKTIEGKIRVPNVRNLRRFLSRFTWKVKVEKVFF